MATLAEVRADVRSRLDESTATFWSDAELNRWINEATRDIARRAEVLQDRADVSAVSGTQEYALSANVVRIHRVEWRPTGGSVYPLEYRDFHSMDGVWWSSQEITEGSPYWYTMWGFPPNLKMVVYPTPAEGGTFKVYYYRLPTAAAADGDTVEVPQGWEDTLALYCEYLALRKDADPRWQEAKALYEEKIAEMTEITRRWTDQADSVQGHTTMVPAWLYGGDF